MTPNETEPEPNAAPMTNDERIRFYDALTSGAESVGIPVTPAQAALCARFADLVRDGNRRTNLTRITAPEEMAVKHFADSLTVFAALPGMEIGTRIADVGTGAGFPGVVLAVLRPDLRITLLDSLNKRLVFLDDALKTLGLRENITLVHARAEDAGRQPSERENYDIVVARAVAQLPTLLEWCGPLTRVGGRFVAMKSGNVDEEKNGARTAADKLGLRLETDTAFALPATGDETEAAARRVLVYRKTRPTPAAYPRKAGEIKAKPL